MAKFLPDTLVIQAYIGTPPVVQWHAHFELPNGHVVASYVQQFHCEIPLSLPQRCTACRGARYVERKWCEACSPGGAVTAHDPTDPSILLPGCTPGTPMLDHHRIEVFKAAVEAKTPEDIRAAVLLDVAETAKTFGAHHRGSPGVAPVHHDHIGVVLGTPPHARVRAHFGLEPEHAPCACEHCPKPVPIEMAADTANPTTPIA